MCVIKREIPALWLQALLFPGSPTFRLTEIGIANPTGGNNVKKATPLFLPQKRHKM